MQDDDDYGPPPDHEVDWEFLIPMSEEADGIRVYMSTISRGQTAYQAWSRIKGAPAFGLCGTPRRLT